MRFFLSVPSTFAGILERFDAQRKRAQDLAVEGLLSAEELRERLAALNDQRTALERERTSVGTVRSASSN